jgi:hypothetical protein
MMNRLDRSEYTLEDALNEINFVEGVLDRMGAPEGLTLWGRVVIVRDDNAAQLDAEKYAYEKSVKREAALARVEAER